MPRLNGRQSAQAQVRRKTVEYGLQQVGEMAEQRRHDPGDQPDAAGQHDEPDFRALKMTLDHGHTAQDRPFDDLSQDVVTQMGVR